MAKLNAKQRNAMPDSEFGIPETRSFPLHDKSHVMSAIRFFKHAPADKKKALAARINRKAKEYGMKISTDGEFAKYLTAECTAFYSDPNKIIIKEASNFGTISPVVAGTTPMYAYPSYDDESLDSATRALAGVYKGDIDKEVIDGDESLPQTSFHVKESMNSFISRKYVDSSRDLIGEVNFNYFTNLLRNSYLIAEYEAMKNYVLNENDKGELIDKVNEILNNWKGFESCKLLFKIIVQCPSMNEIRPILYRVYCQNRKACFTLIKWMVNAKEKHFSMFKHNRFFDKYQSLDNDDFKKPNFIHGTNYDGVTNDEIFINSEIYNEFREIITIELISPLYDSMKDMGSEAFDCSAYELFFLSGKIDGYFITESKTIGIIKKNGEFYVSKLFKMDDTGVVHLLYYPVPLSKVNKINVTMTRPDTFIMEPISDISVQTEAYEFVEESISSKLKRMTSEFLSSLHVNSDGDIKFKIQDKFSFEHYEEVHRLLRMSVESKNYEEMKENLAYVFAMINLIEEDSVYKEHNTRSQEYKDLIRLRALYISDFKVHHRIIIKQDPKFNFTEFYKRSKVNTHIYTIQKKHLKNTVALFRALV